MRILTDADKDELETVHQRLLAVAVEITRRINRGTITPVGKREIVSPLLDCSRRVARIDTGFSTPPGAVTGPTIHHTVVVKAVCENCGGEGTVQNLGRTEVCRACQGDAW